MKESLKFLTLESSESDSDWRSTNSGYADLPTMIAENDLGTMKRGKRLDFNVSFIHSIWYVKWSPYLCSILCAICYGSYHMDHFI